MKIGIVGGGQLARMLALAARPLELDCIFLDPTADACAAAVAEQLKGDYDDPSALDRLAARVDLATYEFENVPESGMEHLAGRCPVYPNANALGTGRDRLNEKRLFRTLGIPTAPFAAVDCRADLDAAVEEIGLPAVLKTRTLGYDGKGQAVLREPADLDGAWGQLGGVPLILEGFVGFEREVSIIAARGRDGATACYPLSENVHREGILRLSHCRRDDPQQAVAEGFATRLLDLLDYVGVLALELFQAGDRLLANEMAPRVHNSGHWTIEGAETSQFENHMRAVAGLPLGSTDPVGHSAMLNLIGHVPPREAILAVAGAHLHDYGKAPRAGRKVGHVTIRAATAETLEQRLTQLQDIVDAG